MKPGETIFGLDFQGHLWIVISQETEDGLIALANFTTHGRSPACGPECLVIAPGEHPFVTRESCIYYRGAILNPTAPLQQHKEQGTLPQSEPVTAELLQRIQRGAIASRFTRNDVRRAVERSLSSH